MNGLLREDYRQALGIKENIIRKFFEHSSEVRRAMEVILLWATKVISSFRFFFFVFRCEIKR